MKSLHERAIQKYFKWCAVFGCLFVLLWIISCIWIRGLAAVVLLFIVLIANKVIVTGVAKKTLLSVLFDEMDAIEFQKVVNDNRFVSPVLYRISSAISAGDYQAVVNIANKQLSNKKAHIKVKYYYLSVLARAYFELRDFEKLNILLKKYKEYNTLHPSSKTSTVYDSAWMFYQHFLEKNYEECKKNALERKQKADTNKRNNKLINLQNDFLYAVSCYENKEFEEAERIFKSVVSYAPKMHLSVVAEKYLAAIAQNSQCPFVAAQVVPDPNFQIHNSKAINKIKRNRLIIIITSIIVVFLVIVGSVFDFFGEKENKELEAYETQLCAALLEQYQKYNLIDYFNFYYNNEITDVFAIVEDENGRYDIGFVVTSDAGETFDFEIAVDDIEYGKSYVMDSATGTHSVIIDVGVKSEKKYDEIIKLKLEDLETAIGFEYLGN